MINLEIIKLPFIINIFDKKTIFFLAGSMPGQIPSSVGIQLQQVGQAIVSLPSSVQIPTSMSIPPPAVSVAHLTHAQLAQPPPGLPPPHQQQQQQPPQQQVTITQVSDKQRCPKARHWKYQYVLVC